VHWGWLWDFRICIVNCNRSVTCVKYLSFIYYININIKIPVSNFSFFIIIYSVSVFVDPSRSVSVTLQNFTHVRLNDLFFSQWPVLYDHLPKYRPFLLNYPVLVYRPV
jgi:hypothetical protein